MRMADKILDQRRCNQKLPRRIRYDGYKSNNHPVILYACAARSGAPQIQDLERKLRRGGQDTGSAPQQSKIAASHPV